MDDRSSQFVEHLVEQLRSMHAKVLALFEQVELTTAHGVDGSEDQTSTTLEPTPEQHMQSVALYSEYRVWIETVLAFLERYSAPAAAALTELADSFSSYILFRRVGTNISDALWRELFRRESSQLVSQQLQTLESARDAFLLLKPRRLVAYQEFMLRFRAEGNNYHVEAISEAGEASREVTIPFGSTEVEHFILKYCQPRHATVRGWTPKSVRPFAEFGQRIFDAVMIGDIRDLFQRTRQHAEGNGLGLRIKLRFRDAPRLGLLPWEFLYDGRDFLGLSGKTPLTRHVDSTAPTRPLLIHAPFRLLVTMSSPDGLPALDVEGEQKRLRVALAPLVALGIMRIDFAPDGTMHTLQRMLRVAEVTGQPYHLWHYIGHGIYDDSERASVLVFEDQRKDGSPTSGFELGTLFSGYPSLALSVLNACEGARTSEDNTLSGVAVALVERGMPAAVAMQFEIADETAVLFAEEFYMALVDGLPVDAAVTEARRSIFFQPNYVEWATPVLFMRVPDGAIFSVQAALDEGSPSRTRMEARQIDAGAP